MKKKNLKDVKEECRRWSEAEWEDYLQLFEVPLKEKLIEPKLYDGLAAKQNRTVFQKLYMSSDAHSKALVERLLSQISPQQKLVLEKIYLDGMSERDIACELRISQQTVHIHKKEALSRLKLLLTGGSVALPYIGEQIFNPKDPYQKIDDLYLEGSLTKDERAHLWALAELGGIKEGDLS